MTKHILLLFETSWDRPQLEACRAGWEGRYAVQFAQPCDADTPWELDVIGYVAAEAERRRGQVAGVFSTSDYPGATASAALSAQLGLPGPAPTAVLSASHKYLSRVAQREAAPEAVPGFARLDPDDPTTWRLPFDFPCFVKPVKGAFSIMSGRIADSAELEHFLRAPRMAWFRTTFLCIFDQLVRHFGVEDRGGCFVAEELLRGRQVTVEGWRTPSDEGLLGIVDSTFAPGTKSFVRFDYPSDLPPEVQARMADISLRVSRHLGLVGTLFNVELIWDPDTDRVAIIEVNPRACGQFSDLYAKVDGVSGFEVALAVAAGDDPPPHRPGSGAFAAAASFPLRVFQPSRVISVPTAERVRAVQAAHPGTLVWIECATDDVLSDFDKLEDGESHRYGVLNLGGADRDELLLQCERIEAELGLVVEPL